MKKRLVAALLLVLITAWALHSYAKTKRSAWNVIKNPETVQMLKSFVAAKKVQAYAATNGVPPEIQTMFKYAERGDWLALSNSFAALKARNEFWYPHHGWSDINSLSRRDKVRVMVNELISRVGAKIGRNWKATPPPELGGTSWIIADEMRGALESLLQGSEYPAQFGQEVINSIPPGSIYFGGTDQGRFIIMAMCKSQADGDPFFTLSQNALADESYLGYLRSIYGNKIEIPTAEDSQRCFQEYTEGAQQRLQNHTSGQVAVMEINGLLVKTIFDKNPDREFYVEESFPLDWMYPRLEPHGLIFKINRQPLAELSDDIVQRDRDYWHKSLEPKIGGWLMNETSVETITVFAKKIFLQHDLQGFGGDARFVQNDYSCKMFSKERASIAGLYAWRASHSTNDSEKQRMTSEADLAFRQAWALCPYAPEATYRYINFLLVQNRPEDALLVAETSASLPQNKDNDQAAQLPAQLRQWQQEHSPKPSN